MSRLVRVVAPLLLLALLALSAESRAQGRRKPPPTASSEAARTYRADRARLADARTPETCEALAEEIARAHPASVSTATPAEPPAPLGRRLESDPEGAFRDSSTAERASIYRKLRDDAIQRSLELKVAAAPQDAPDLAESARNRLPDRKDLPVFLLDLAAKGLGDLHQAEVEALARAFEKAGRLNGARDLRRRWLDDQREHRLGPADADGRVALAAQYQTMLGDTKTAAELLQAAIAIDPQSPAAAASLAALGFRREGDRWVPIGSEPMPAKPVPATPRPPADEAAGSVIGLTRDQLRRRQGTPARVARIATQGRVVEQWSYDLDRDARKFYNFLRRDPHAEPVVVSEGSVP